MKYALLLTLSLLILSYPKPANAIIFLPAIILIPIAKIVAVIIGSILLPSVGFSLFWKKFFGGTWKKILFALLFFLLAVGLLISLVLYIQNPNRPFF